MPKRSPEADLIRVRHMLEAAMEALSFTRDKSRKDLETHRMLVLSLVKEIEIIGEAAAKVTPEFQNQFPQIPWTTIVGIRNRLIHGYFTVNLDIIWNTVQKDLPVLIKALQKILS
jgi:uncharacterized protein with HEPN domain